MRIKKGEKLFCKELGLEEENIPEVEYSLIEGEGVNGKSKYNKKVSKDISDVVTIYSWWRMAC